MDSQWLKWTDYSLFSKCCQRVTLAKLQWQLTPNLIGPRELQGMSYLWPVFHLKRCVLEGFHLTMTVTEHSGEAKSTFLILFLSE